MSGLRDFAVYGVIVAGILVVVRPGSNGAGFVQAAGGAVTNFIQGITGQNVTKFAAVKAS